MHASVCALLRSETVFTDADPDPWQALCGKEFPVGQRRILKLYHHEAERINLYTRSNSSTISFDGGAVTRLTTTIVMAEQTKAGSSS